MRMWYLPSFFTRGEMWLCPLNSDKRRLYSSATLEGAFWSGTGFFQLFVTYSVKKIWPLEDPAPKAISAVLPGVGISDFLQWWMMVRRWSFAHMALAGLVFRSTETTQNENICWSMTLSFLVFISLLLGTQLWVYVLWSVGCIVVLFHRTFLWGKVGGGLRWEKKKNFKNPTIRSSTIPPVQSATGCSFSTVVRGISKTVLVYHRTFINIMHKSHQI